MKKKRILVWFAAILTAVTLAGCSTDGQNVPADGPSVESTVEDASTQQSTTDKGSEDDAAKNGSTEATDGAEDNGAGGQSGEAGVISGQDGKQEQAQAVEKNGEIYVLYTSDVHCGVDQGFGYAGLYQIRETLEAQGYDTILVDDGDAIQGELLGLLTKGEAIIDMMNAMKYDVAIPGNHEFDYGVERFLELSKKAEFPYVSCNLNYKETPLFDPYVIKEVAGMKIAFVGVTTPSTITQSTPKYFQDETGEYVYGFLRDATGEKLYAAVQKAVDDARAEGADLVYLLAHLGMNAEDSPWTYAEVIENTNGIDVVLDGHSHDAEQIKMKNKDGQAVIRSACGTKLTGIGYSHISADKAVTETGIWNWTSSVSVPELLGLENPMEEMVAEAMVDVQDLLDRKIADSDYVLTIYDPQATDSKGNPIRMVRRAETNLGDFCADAIRAVSGADIAMVNGGGVRANLAAGEITYGDLVKVHPFGNQICMIRATGQQILDALEWSAPAVPDEFGGFLQVSGMRYEIDATVPSGCIVDENGMFAGIRGKRRVTKAWVGDEELNPKKTYVVAGIQYTLLQGGDGYTVFKDAEILAEEMKLDVQVLIDYVTSSLGGVIDGATYGDAYGQGRITIIDEE